MLELAPSPAWGSPNSSRVGKDVTSANLSADSLLSGFHAPEISDGEQFRWTESSFRLEIPNGSAPFLVVDAMSYFRGEVQTLRLETPKGAEITSFALAEGRRNYVVRLPGLRPLRIAGRLNRTIPPHMRHYDSRELGIRIYSLRLADETSAWIAPPPVGLCLETCARCNLACLTCPTRAGRGVRDEGMSEMPLDWALEVMRSSPECRTFAIHGNGEPFLSDTFKGVLRSQPDGDPRFVFSTNLTLLDEGLLDLVTLPSVREITVSLDAARPETFRLIRGTEMEPILANLRGLVSRRNANGRPTPRLLAHMVLMRMNISELEDMVRLAAEFGLDGLFLWHANEGRGYDWVVERDGFTFDYRQQSLRAVPEECNRLLERALQLAADLGLEVRYDAVLRDFLVPEAASSRRRPCLMDCPYPWKEAYVLSDGRVQFCPLQDIDKPLGRIDGRAGINEVWNSPASKRVRAMLASGQVPDSCRGAGCKYVRCAEEAPSCR